MNTESARSWLKQAKHELEVAKQNLNLGNYDVVALYSHLCVETLFKAIKEYRGIPFKKNHKNIDLANELGASNFVLEQVGTSCKEIFTTRYPDPYYNPIAPCEIFTYEDAKDRILRAEHVFEEYKSEYTVFDDED